MTTTKATAQLAMTTIDCADPKREATFWAAALGWNLAHADDDYGLVTSDGQRLGFGRVEGWVAPSWPDANGGKQFHLDLAVDDLAAAEATMIGLGASKVTPQPGETWVVMADPDGHLFCLTQAANWAGM